MKKFIALITCLGLAACAAPAETIPDATSSQFVEVQVKGMVATPRERAACDGVGGTISRQGLLGGEICVIPYPDAGMFCTDSDECLGQCRADSSLDTQDAMNAISGTCQVNTNPFGCYAMIEDGKGTPTLCVD